MHEFLKGIEEHPLASVFISLAIILILIWVYRLVLYIVRRGGSIGFIKGGTFPSEFAHKQIEYDRTMKAIVTDAVTADRVLLGEQMKIVEEQVDKSIIKMREVHLDLLISHLGDEEEGRKSDSVERYQHITEIVRKRLIDLFRIAMRENHFAEKTDPEFYQYMNDKLLEYYGVVEHIIDHGYKHAVVGVVELREEQRKHMNFYASLLQIVFVSARGLAIGKADKVEKLWKAYNITQAHYIKTGDVIHYERVA